MAATDAVFEGTIDLHVHAGPDVRPRKTSGLELAQAARAAGMRGFLLKNHHAPTVLAAETLRRAVDGLEVFGGVVLNESVGGLNPAAVEAALKMGAAAVWMPTLDAEQERAFRGRAGTGLRVIDGRGKLLPAVHEILRLVADSGVMLCLGHLSLDEMFAVVQESRAQGLTKIVINHPEIEFLNLSVAAQRELSGPGLYFERCYVRSNSAVSWEGLAAAIRAVGVETTVLATDLGQPEEIDPVAGMRDMLVRLAGHGFSRSELETMACRNPAMLLGLDDLEGGARR